jgi:IS6 family transposase
MYACVENRHIKYRNNVNECDHGRLKRIIGTTPGFKSMKTACVTIDAIKVMRAAKPHRFKIVIPRARCVW